MLYIVINCIVGNIFVQIGPDLVENSMKNHPKLIQNDCYAYFLRSLKWEPKLLLSRNLSGLCHFYEAFHLMQNTGHKSKGVKIRGLMKMSHNKRFFVIIFDIYYPTLKIVTYVMSYTDMRHGKSFIKTWAYLRSFDLSSCR